MSILLISEAFEMYRNDVIVFTNQSRRTEEMNRCAAKCLIKYTGDMPIYNLTFDIVRDWKADMNKTMSQNTVRGYILKLRVVLKHLRRKDIRCLNPELIGVPKRKQAPVKFISEKEVVRLLDCIFQLERGYTQLNRYRNRAIVSFLYASGLRVTELVNLNRQEINENNTFTVVGKGGEMRLCFFDNRTRLYLDEYLALREDDNPALFMSDFVKGRISKNTIEEVFRTVMRRSNCKIHVTPHTMRHSFATNLLRNNTNLLYVSKFLGHKSVETTQQYTHVVDEDLKAIYIDKHSI